jgi:hypothetical protein
MAIGFLFVGCDNTQKFADDYIEEWKIERYGKIFEKYFFLLGATNSSLFILSDCYNGDDDRHDYELDDTAYRLDMKALLIHNDFLLGEFDRNKLDKVTIRTLDSYSK